jgi:hypothetical protein
LLTGKQALAGGILHSEGPGTRALEGTNLCPTVHAAVPDFVDASLTKIITLRRKLSGASSAVRSLFGAAEDQDQAVDNLEALQVGWSACCADGATPQLATILGHPSLRGHGTHNRPAGCFCVAG